MPFTQSFTQIIKEEICSNTYPEIERLKALLASYIRINGTVVFRAKKSGLSLVTENAKIARFIYESLNNVYQANAHLSFQKNKRKTTSYIINVGDVTETIIEDLDISFFEGKISKNIVKNDVTIAGYLAGAFLASGSCNSPLTSNYHLEISLNNENYAKWMSHLFSRYKNSNIEPKIIKRRDKYVIYFKKSEQIANFLIIIGAVSSCMEFENVRVDRDFNNNTNRLTNLDTANMTKIYETAKKQIIEIKTIDKYLGINNLKNEKMRLLCRLRLDNEYSSLIELSNLMSEQINKPITKSNINHLFRSIHQMYLKVKGNE